MFLWVRVGWLAMGIVGAVVLARLLDGRSAAVTVVATALAAVAWGAGIVAVLVPRSVSLTVLRVLGFGLLFPAAVVDAFVDGSSYGPERRFALRTPLAVLVGPAELAWSAVIGPVVAGPLLLASGNWVAGVVVVAVGAVVVRPAARSLHQLSRRWVVFVPAGLVVHDPVVLTDAVLFPKRIVRSLGPAPVGDEAVALDVTGGAQGLVVEVALTEPATVGMREGRTQGRTIETERVLITPIRPGALLAEWQSRNPR